MSDAAAGSPAPRFTFRWEARRQSPIILAGFILLSIIGHVATVFVFQVVYPPRATLPMQPPQLTILSPDIPEHAALLRWVDAEDPALVAALPEVLPDNLLAVPYRASFMQPRTALRTLPAGEPRMQSIPARNSIEIIRSVEKQDEPAPEPIPLAATRVEYSASLHGRKPTEPPTFEPMARAREPLQPAEFLIGVNDRGEVRYTYLQRSSGQSELDAEAREYLAGLQFDHGGRDIAWGFATVYWGDDAYAPEPPDTAAPVRKSKPLLK